MQGCTTYRYPCTTPRTCTAPRTRVHTHPVPHSGTHTDRTRPVHRARGSVPIMTLFPGSVLSGLGDWRPHCKFGHLDWVRHGWEKGRGTASGAARRNAKRSRQPAMTDPLCARPSGRAADPPRRVRVLCAAPSGSAGTRCYPAWRPPGPLCGRLSSRPGGPSSAPSPVKQGQLRVVADSSEVQKRDTFRQKSVTFLRKVNTFSQNQQ